MNELASSRNLHPERGGRFVFEREGERYRVAVYLPHHRLWTGTLSWLDDRATLEGPPMDDEELVWAREELLKLARVVHREARDKLIRWRG